MFSFGTDGYRAIIAEGFDFETVGKLTQALCSSLKSNNPAPYILIGYDTRFLSDKFAAYAAEVASHEGIKAELTDSFVPTPMLSHAVTAKKADAGIVITASHNPYYYNGFKIKNNQGGSANPEQIAALQPFLDQKKELPVHRFHAKSACPTFNPKEAFFKHINILIPDDRFKNSNLKVVVDPLFGAGIGYFKELLQNYSLKVEEIHNQANPYFGGLQPEPIGDNLNELRESVINNNADIGLALDGDADRSGVVDEKGAFINSHQIFALLLHHLVENKGLKGLVVKTYSTTSLVDIMAEEYGLEVKQTPIGFKHISNLMLNNDVLIGGEESGGIGIKGHIPERDGMLIGLMLLELMIETGEPIGQLLNNLYKQFGTFSYDRIDKIIQAAGKESLYKNLAQSNLSKITNKGLRQVLNEDGYKYEFEDRSWLMFRLSGTESVVRIYAEAADPDEVNRLLTVGDELVANLTNNS